MAQLARRARHGQFDTARARHTLQLQQHRKRRGVELGQRPGIDLPQAIARAALECGAQTTASAQVYRFQIQFTDDDNVGSTATAGAQPAVRVALVKN